MPCRYGKNQKEQFGVLNAHVISDFVFLNPTALPLHELLHNEAAHSITCIPLFGVRLDDNTAVHRRSMVVLMFTGVVGVNSVSHITANQE